MDILSRDDSRGWWREWSMPLITACFVIGMIWGTFYYIRAERAIRYTVTTDTQRWEHVSNLKGGIQWVRFDDQQGRCVVVNGPSVYTRE